MGEKVITRNCTGYLPSQVALYLQNIHIQPRWDFYNYLQNNWLKLIQYGVIFNRYWFQRSLYLFPIITFCFPTFSCRCLSHFSNISTNIFVAYYSAVIYYHSSLTFTHFMFIFSDVFTYHWMPIYWVTVTVMERTVIMYIVRTVI